MSIGRAQGGHGKEHLWGALVKISLLAILLSLAPLCAAGADLQGNIPERFSLTPDPNFRSLEDRVINLKQDVLDLSKDLSRLQAQLLTPSSTQIVVFLSLQGEAGLDSIQLKLDERVVTNYLYTAREQEALRRGGVQRLYLGNLAVGPHRVTATLLGKDGKGKKHQVSASGDFEKDLTAKLIELKLSGSNQELPNIAIREVE